MLKVTNDIKVSSALAPQAYLGGLRPVLPSGSLTHHRPPNLKCLKHKATSAIILNRFETLNRSLLTKMANLAPPPPPASASAPSSSTLPAEPSTTQAGDASEPMAVDPAAAPPPAGAAGKKKKGKGKKK